MTSAILLVFATSYAPTPLAAKDAARVLVVANRASAESLRIARYYVKKRGIPSQNLVLVDTTGGEDIAKAKYEVEIERPVRAAALRAKGIDFIVLTRGVPIRFSDWGQSGGYSLDAMLGAGGLSFAPIASLDRDNINRTVSPYYNRKEAFSHARFGFYLVTRLDGYTEEDALRLVDDSMAAKAWKGPFFFDAADNRKSGDYLEMQKSLNRADSALRTKGLRSSLDETPAFLAPATPVAGYASWGSNDSGFNNETYKKIRFLPGALAETFVSASGRTFRPTTGGQSLVADLIASGVTGVKGYVSEPYTIALARPDILFDRYTSGFNLAESFYMASPVLKWKDVVIGDPLCRPYGK